MGLREKFTYFNGFKEEHPKRLDVLAKGMENSVKQASVCITSGGDDLTDIFAT